jgi:hypothetical protein
MDRSSEERIWRQVNGRTRLEVNLSEPLALFETLATRLEFYTVITNDTFKAMAAKYTPRIEALKDEVEALEAFQITAYSKIFTLHEFDLVFYDDLCNLHNLIIDAAENTSNDFGALSNDFAGRIGVL